jgi:regulator of sirC expression with transglutaminase-like and TPR domain
MRNDREAMSGPDLSDPEAYLRRAGDLSADEIDLGAAALALASLDRPRVPADRYLTHLEELAAAVPPAHDLEARIDAVNAALFEAFGYRGDRETYDDLQNANLMRVIDRRRGLPISLAILWLHAARAQGWSAHGVNFPGHFLVALEDGGDRALIDVFDEGRRRSAAELRGLLKVALGDGAELRPDHYAYADNRAILVRLQHNIRSRLVHARSFDRALAVVESMLWLDPRNAGLWYEAGALNAATENLHAAAAALKKAIELGSDDDIRHQSSALLQRVQAHLN